MSDRTATPRRGARGSPRIDDLEVGGTGGTPPEAPSRRLAPRVAISLIRDQVPYYGLPVRSPQVVWKLLLAEGVASWDRERFLVLALDGRHRGIGLEEVAVGTATACLVHPREVFKALLLANAVAFALIHNHPSGDPSPSREDREITRRLKDAGELMGIRLLDHVVVTADAFYSFREMDDL